MTPGHWDRRVSTSRSSSPLQPRPALSQTRLSRGSCKRSRATPVLDSEILAPVSPLVTGPLPAVSYSTPASRQLQAAVSTDPAHGTDGVPKGLFNPRLHVGSTPPGDLTDGRSRAHRFIRGGMRELGVNASSSVLGSDGQADKEGGWPCSVFRFGFSVGFASSFGPSSVSAARPIRSSGPRSG